MNFSLSYTVSPMPELLAIFLIVAMHTRNLMPGFGLFGERGDSCPWRNFHNLRAGFASSCAVGQRSSLPSSLRSLRIACAAL